MLTIVTTPRPLYGGKFRMDFDNAVESWLRLDPKPQILVFGGEKSIVDRKGVTFIPNYPKNEQNLPFLDGCLEIAQEMAENRLLMLTSDHLILRSDFMVALKRLAALSFHCRICDYATDSQAEWKKHHTGHSHNLMKHAVSEPRHKTHFRDFFAATGQRWDRLVDLPIDFNEDWENEVVRGRGRPKGGGAKDWFVFRTPLPFKAENFVLGRRRWDSWFLHALCASGMPVVDVSCVVTPVHPVHGYSHVPLGERAGVGVTTDPGTLHNMAIEKSTPAPNHIDHLGWGLTCDGLLSGDDWEGWKADHEWVWLNKRIKHEQWATLKHPAYCYDPPPGVGRKV